MSELPSKNIDKELLTVKRVELQRCLEEHLGLAGVQLYTDEKGKLHIQTPDITTDSSLFHFIDTKDFGRFYRICRDLGELNFSIKIPSVTAGSNLRTFDIDQLDIDEDIEVFRFVLQLGESLRKNTIIG